VTLSYAESSSESSTSVEGSKEDRISAKERRLSALSKKTEAKVSRIPTKARSVQVRSANEDLQRQRKERERRAKAILNVGRKRAEEERRRKALSENTEYVRIANEKLQDALQLASTSPYNYINIETMSDFQRFVLDGHRPYWAFVTLTSLGSGSNRCELCHELHRNLLMVTPSNYDEMQKNPSRTPIIFFNVDASKAHEVFQSMQLNSVPLLFLLPPRLGSKPLKPSFHSTVDSKYRFPAQQQNSPFSIVEYVQRVSHTAITLNLNGITGEEIIIAVLFLAIAIFVIYRYFEALVRFYRNERSREHLRVLICWGSWAVYMWCISGGMYNIIRGTEFARYEKDKPTEYISGDPRDQYGAEGLILGFFNVAAAAMLTLCNEQIRDTSSRTSTSKNNVLKNIWSGIVPLFTPVACLLLLVAFWFQIVAIYSSKNRGYNRGFVWY
jgi:hypothetical protein